MHYEPMTNNGAGVTMPPRRGRQRWEVQPSTGIGEDMEMYISYQ
jgi:hypothetical protein